MMMGAHRRGGGFLTNFDPRAKLLLLVPLLVCFFLPVSPVVLAPYAAALVLLIAVALGPAALLPPLRAIAPVLILICLLTPPFYGGGKVLLRVLNVTLLTTAGLSTTLTLGLRFLGMTLGFFIVMRTVTLDELVLSLRWFGLPYTVCLVIVIALRTVPAVSSTWHNALDAHRLRSDPSRQRGRRRLVERYLPVLTSVFIEAVKGIPVLAMALESRGFGRTNPRTEFLALKGGSALIADMAVCAGLAVVFLLPAFLRW
jgi:energy-coupling factor transport system permease protein